MASSLETGLLLLLLGMSTVFLILGIVVFTGKVLILTVNKFTSTPIADIKPPDVHIPDPSSGAKIAAITGAIHSVTGGKGQITHIERLEE